MVVFGDVHMCHPQTRTEKIFEEIKECLPYNESSSTIDILIIEGDYWHRLMPNNHPDVYTTKASISYILRWCKDFDVHLLLLDGTPSHDANQMQWFTHINKESNINAKVRFFDKVTIDYLAELDMHFLYVPDRPRETPENIWESVQKELENNNIEKVDVSVMHGCFQYQIPQIASDHKHVEENYLSMTTGPIFIGHVHTFSTYERIIACGSFSRLGHGEEEPKGYVECLIQPNGEFKAKFIENKKATIYKTLDLTDIPYEESIELAKKTAESLPLDSKLRLVIDAKHPLAADKVFFTLKADYAHIQWTIKVNQDESVVAKKDIDDDIDYVPLVIDRENIVQLIMEKAHAKGYTSDVVEPLPNYLEEVI